MDVIIIGAGAAGLMAAKKISAAGLIVCVLEAEDRVGGRIHSLQYPHFPIPAEGGAEFIHGNLEVTLSLLREAGIDTLELTGEVMQLENGQWKQENDFFSNSGEIISRMKDLKEDMTIADFIDKYFNNDTHTSLRKSLASYIEGYYSAEIKRISAKSFLKEWMSEDNQQYRPAGGYQKMIKYLAEECTKAGVLIQLSTPVKQVRWSQGQVEVFDSHHHSYVAHKALVTVSLGVWKAEKESKGAIEYYPPLEEKEAAAAQMGFGSVVKILLYFKEPFWENLPKDNQPNFKNVHMVLSDLAVETWWTQLPERQSLLTGWVSGPAAERMKNEPEDEIIKQALFSLSTIFCLEPGALKEKVQQCKVFNWTIHPYTLGSYSYSTLQTAEARKTLIEPLENTLFFAGEALYDGPEMGTVEAALTSGQEVADRILLNSL